MLDPGAAFTRALEVMNGASLNVVEPSERAVAGGLARFGLSRGWEAAEAK